MKTTLRSLLVLGLLLTAGCETMTGPSPLRAGDQVAAPASPGGVEQAAPHRKAN
jgi:hypothetical protein